MSHAFRCDYCGRDIGEDEFFITLNTEGSDRLHPPAGWRDGWLGHYHHRPCWDSVLESVDLMREFAPLLARDTLSHRSVEERRDQHVRRVCDPRALAAMGSRWLGELALKGGTYKAFARHFDTIGEVCARSPAQLVELKGIGWPRVRELVAALEHHGLALARDDGVPTQTA